jgi:hypothetical protein
MIREREAKRRAVFLHDEAVLGVKLHGQKRLELQQAVRIVDGFGGR